MISRSASSSMIDIDSIHIDNQAGEDPLLSRQKRSWKNSMFLHFLILSFFAFRLNINWNQFMEFRFDYMHGFIFIITNLGFYVFTFIMQITALCKVNDGNLKLYRGVFVFIHGISFVIGFWGIHTLSNQNIERYTRDKYTNMWFLISYMIILRLIMLVFTIILVILLAILFFFSFLCGYTHARTLR